MKLKNSRKIKRKRKIWIKLPNSRKNVEIVKFLTKLGKNINKKKCKKGQKFGQNVQNLNSLPDAFISDE